MVGVWRHANARIRGMKRVQVEPHLSVTGACSAEWVPIKPKTDAAFLFALVHVLLHEIPRERLDVAFLAQHTSSPYLVGPHGYYLRDRATRKPLVWDTARGAAVPFDTPGIAEALEGRFDGDAIEIGPDDDVLADGVLDRRDRVHASSSRTWRRIRPNGRSAICDVPAATMRRIAHEFIDHAHVGETIEIEGKRLPYRPVAVSLGKTVNNGWGGFECVWARTMLAALVGGLEVPGGTLGTTVRLNRQVPARVDSVQPGPDGFMDVPAQSDRQGALVAEAEHPQRVPDDGAARRQRPVEPGARADAFLVDVPRRDAEGPAARHAARRLVRLPHQSGDLVLGHRPRSATRWRASRSWSPSRTRATRPIITPTSCCPRRPTSKACS